MTTSATQPAFPTTFPCENCGQWFPLGTLACSNCGALVYRRRLEELATQATRAEAIDPQQAAIIWRDALQLLPPHSQPYQAVAQRAAALSAGLAAPGIVNGGPPEDSGGEVLPYGRVPGSDPWPVAFAKTAGSMLLCIVVYTILWPGPLQARLMFAAGLTGLILVHEFGHVIAMKYYKLSASPPIFIPFLGAVINMRQEPRNAWEEAVVGIGGPALGTVGALAMVALLFGLGLEPGTETYDLVKQLAITGAAINLFNLLPFPPLDGGRITAAVSPWIWIAGVAGLGYQIYTGFLPIYFAALIVFMGLPRIANTLRDRKVRGNSYFRVPFTQSAAMAICYVALAALLTGIPQLLGKSSIFGG